MMPGVPPLPRLPEPEVILEEVFCTCNRPFQGFMVTCDSCGDMFHGVCVGLTPSLAAKRGKFTCKQCGDSVRPQRRQRGITTPNSESKSPATSIEELRATVRTTLTETLGESAESARMAVAIEAALNDATPATGKLYRPRARSLFTNLGDARNAALRQRLLSGELRAADLINMSTDELAPPEVAEFKKRRQRELMQAIVLPAEAFERVQSQPWDLNHHYMNSLEHRSLALTASAEAAEQARLEAAPAAADRQQSFSMPEKTSSFGEGLTVERPPLPHDDLQSASTADRSAREESEEEKASEHDERAAAFAGVAIDDLNLHALPSVAETISSSLLPASPPKVARIAAPVALAISVSANVWRGTVDCPGMTQFAATATLGRSAFASLLKYAVALEHSTSRTRSILQLTPASPSDEPHLLSLIEDLLKRDRGAACRIPEDCPLREAFLLPVSDRKPAPSLFGGPPPRSGDLLVLIAVHNRATAL